ncbi:MAG: oxidoreductase [Clostridiales bacterium 43-6]|nr:MAG: oxidoreductase [Clostridiales bacterium 43-6]
MSKVKIGVIGCGNISDIYFKNLTGLYENTEVFACCDLNTALSEAAAKKYGIPHIYTMEEMLTDTSIELVINLTPPKAHFTISKQILSAGKHLYSEKPLAIEFSEASELVSLAKEKGLYLGCSPDTFLGAGIGTARKLIDDGVIGSPIACTAFFACHGPEDWHPNPEFFYQYGAGPMLDMGPYYLTTLAFLMGGFHSVSGITNISIKERLITSEPKKGSVIAVEVPTYISGHIRFQSGAVGSITTTFDVWKHKHPLIEIYGTEGTISVPDPNFFDGPVMVQTRNEEFKEAPLFSPYTDNVRGLGISQMAKCIREGGRNKASGEVALHVLEAMKAFDISAERGAVYQMTTKIEPMDPMPTINKPGEV